jgi:hypothetical protein
MNLKLIRQTFALYGIEGELFDDKGLHVCFTLEHAYEQPDGSYQPKVPPGIYVCQRGRHRLEGMNNSFETFEITNVPGHTNILFHKGNYNNDSEGCVLVGAALGVGCILESAIAFGSFLQLQEGLESFTLTVQ